MNTNLSEKSELHPRNPHRSAYDFKDLINTCPDLKEFVFVNQYKTETINFSDPKAVKCLNKALLKFHYGISDWDIPSGYLCPPIPGRADYIHYMADLLASCNDGKIPVGPSVSALDIGVGANAVYPLIGIKEYGWNFVGSDIDPISISSVQKIINHNTFLKDKLNIKTQNSKYSIFKGIIDSEIKFDITICNPPFHASAEEAMQGTRRRQRNMGISKAKKPVLNFGGRSNELWCEGGEAKFVSNMVRESAVIPTSVFWYSSLISSKDSLSGIYRALNHAKAKEVKTIEMKQGQKISRIVAWTFLSKAEMEKWKQERWNTI